MSVGIRAIGMYVPPDVRGNDWWDANVVARWVEQRAARPPAPEPPNLTPGARRILRAGAEQAKHPYLGTHQRHVLAATASVHDMEERAARDAIARAGIDPSEIDVVLTHVIFAEQQLANPACILHERLGLAPACMSLHTEATAYTSLAQLAIADALISSGRARNALLVQSCAATRFMDMTDPGSVLLGDGATAMVVGPVRDGRGIAGATHFTEGGYVPGLVMSVRGGAWYDPGVPQIHIGNPATMAAAQLRIADTCEQALTTLLERTRVGLDALDFLCVFQGTPWLQPVVYEQLGVRHLEPFDVFQRFAYLSSAMIPAALFTAEQAGRLADDMVVAIVSGGTGMTYGATLLRWGT